MENFVVISKIKKYIKDKYKMNTSVNFFEALNADLKKTLLEGIKSAQANKRKTVMGRDLNFYLVNPNAEEMFVVASKIKKFVKESSELSTAQNVMEQLTDKVRRLCDIAVQNAIESKRKTVMDRDFAPITSIHSN